MSSWRSAYAPKKMQKTMVPQLWMSMLKMPMPKMTPTLMVAAIAEFGALSSLSSRASPLGK